ncbi:serine--tRNA ligase [Rhodomicrobium udaipurense JA643]|uniref:Serine--tRNA ligase n=1 Tax=Rhodomicrobium udaipurense TaxID=1202716 RepID=A0A8I1GFK6_9HYPH|nr:serine--tRNA ligase [Rhodomicrobium udaipurense]KAI94868.1 serine--tRNA ligase [Rhodomicrobium udaipurense JA643]MBJ7542375.1 serine--tRNA ligase [Rhodomicrobium udaipurense]
MLDLKWIRENPADFDQGLARRGAEPLSSTVLALDEELRAHKKALQDMQARRNAASKEIGKAKGKGGDPAKAEALMAEVADLKGAIAAGEAKERELDAAITALLAGIPNMLLPAPEVPDGKDESENVELRRVGSPRDFAAEDFAPKQHFELGEALGLMDFEAAAKISGARFTVLKGQLARLERALGQFMLDVQTSEHGYTEVNPPLLVKDPALLGTAQLPKFAEDLFSTRSSEIVGSDEVDVVIADTAGTMQFNFKGLRKKELEQSFNIGLGGTVSVNVSDARFENGRLIGVHPVIEVARWLIPTAEVPLTNLVRESILPEADLPLRFTALTPCFRAEAGAAGRDTRGMIRQHQFYKVEMVSITTPEASPAEHARMTGCAEEILKRLGLPYRVVVLCAGDTGFGARKTHDIEVWLPGQGAYREISSVSNCGDFQARRMQARFRPSAAKDVQFVHTLNGSGLAVGRALIAVIENYQEADGSIRVPDALLPYMGGVTRIGA